METTKQVHTLCIDTGPIIKDVPSISSLLAQAEKIVTVPAVVAEIRDASTRSRFETTIKPFLELRSPSDTSLKAIQDFARRTGDLSVLSKQDVQLLALTRDVELERNGGDWRLRSVPGQKQTNGPPPPKKPAEEVEQSQPTEAAGVSALENAQEGQPLLENAAPESHEVPSSPSLSDPPQGPSQIPQASGFASVKASTEEDINKALENTSLDDSQPELHHDSSVSMTIQPSNEPGEHSSDSEAEASDDSDGWITHTNLKRRQVEDSGSLASSDSIPKRTLQAALLTSDFAMQNVALQMNLNLLSPSSSSFTRVTQLRTYVLRCHACFNVVKDTSKQFCPRCGKPSLTRVSCSTNSKGEFKLHLKKNFQWNNRGERYSIPKPVTGNASGKVRGGGGKDGWGAGLILAEDQREYEKALKRERYERKKDLMDEDAELGILSGRREAHGGRIRVGAGRNVNSRKR